jgi:hypothetical protein
LAFTLPNTTRFSSTSDWLSAATSKEAIECSAPMPVRQTMPPGALPTTAWAMTEGAPVHSITMSNSSAGNLA